MTLFTQNSVDVGVNTSELRDIYAKLLRLEEILSVALNNSGFSFISWFTKPPTGWKTLSQSDLKKWHDDCYSIRNKVIHEGYNKVTRQEAIKAYEASLAAISYVHSEVRKVIKI